MKKFILIIVSVFALSASIYAQPRAIGIRGGYGAEVSYQHSFVDQFGELDLGWSPLGVNVAAAYDFIFASTGNFNFYVGPGAQLTIFATKGENEEHVSGLNLGVLAQLGAEFQCPGVPINISLDWRPVVNFFGVGSSRGFCGNYAALGVRYRF